MSAKSTAESLYAGMAVGDIPNVVALLADDVEWTESEGFVYGGTYRGPDAIVNGVFARLGGEWDEFAAEVTTLIAEGDVVTAIGTYSGTHKQTGKPFSARFAHSMTVQDGKIVRFEQICDTAQVNLAL
jgi:ketosteroid isomerase-like protein